MYDFLVSGGCLTCQQHGFVKKRSTVSAAFQLTQEILVRLEKGEDVLTISFDLSRAFDMVDHELMLDKFERYGVRGVALNLFQNYLADRRQLVEQTTDSTTVRSSQLRLRSFSVPQGSILGPLLFVIYVNDLPSITGETIVLYADDTGAVISDKDHGELHAKAKTVVGGIESWVTGSGLCFNAAKTQFMFSSPSNSTDFKLKVGAEDISSSEGITFLGV